MRLMPRRADVLWAALAAALALLMLQLDAADTTQADRAPDLLGVVLVIAACAPVAMRRAHRIAAAVAALAIAGVALALGYLAIVPVVVGLTLCSQAAIHSARRVTVPLAAYAGTVMAVAVTITGDDTPAAVGVLGGLAIGVTSVLIGDVIRSERERTREAVAEERLRIARDVHDITGHHLSAISLQAAGAGRATSDPVARAALERIHWLTSEALGQTRSALGVLREDGPADRAPAPRLEQVEQLLEPARHAGLAVDLRLEGAARPVAPQIELCAYRVVQEALTNVVRHAAAGAVRVGVSYGKRELVVTVDDDGVGRAAPAGGGIAGMRERIEVLGGTLAAGPTADGWSVRATLPLDAEPEPGDGPRARGVAQVAP
jgi:signal transduction histidine kinase